MNARETKGEKNKTEMQLRVYFYEMKEKNLKIQRLNHKKTTPTTINAFMHLNSIFFLERKCS